MPRLESGTTLESASATGTNQELSMLVRQQPILAGLRPVRHAFDGRYSNVETRIASSPDRLWSRIESRYVQKLDLFEFTPVDRRRIKLAIMTERHEERLQSVPFRADRPGRLDESSPIPAHRLYA